jgi:uncharacterized damage-inducible protein DinB
MKLAALSVALAAIVAVAVNAKSEKAGSAHILKENTLFTLGDAEKKLNQLAEAFPDDKWTYRPAEGVRSTSDVFMHVACANYFLATQIGAKAPEGFSPDCEKKAGDKAAVLAEFKKSFEHVHAAIEKMTEEQMVKPIKLFGHDMHEQTVMMILANHAHEHLGQAIAYARANNITPPWSKKGD